MATFKINGKEHELKLTYTGVGLLNKSVEGGAKVLIIHLLSGDTFDLFPEILYASLLHTKEGIQREDIEAELEALFEREELTQKYIDDIVKEVVYDSFFYRETIQTMLAKNPEMAEALKQI